MIPTTPSATYVATTPQISVATPDGSKSEPIQMEGDLLMLVAAVFGVLIVSLILGASHD